MIAALAAFGLAVPAHGALCFDPGCSQPPTVRVTAPTAGQVVPPGGVILQATAGGTSPILEVYFYLDNDPNPACVDSTYPYSCSWNAGPENSAHTVFAEAMDDNGEVGTSGSVSFTVSGGAGGGAPAMPAGFQAQAVSATAIKLTWSASEGAERYQIDRYAADWTMVADVGLVREFIHQGLQPNSAHNYRIKAYNRYGSSPYSQASAITPKEDVPPTVKFEAPLTQSTIQGVVPLIASATDDIGMASVRFFFIFVQNSSGNEIGTVTTPSADGKFRVSWDTSGQPEGDYRLLAIASDSAGKTASTEIRVTLRNASQPPSVSFVNPTPPEGYAVSGIYILSATAYDAAGAAPKRIEFFIDAIGSVQGIQGTDSCAGVKTCTVTWYTAGLDGPRTLIVRAVDSQDIITARERRVTVSNGNITVTANVPARILYKYDMTQPPPDSDPWNDLNILTPRTFAGTVAGNYRIKLTAAGYQDWVSPLISLNQGQSLTVTGSLGSGGGAGDIFLDAPAAGSTVASPVTVSGAYPCDDSATVTFFSWPADQPLAFRSWPVSLDKSCAAHNGHANTYGWTASWTPSAGTYMISADYRNATGSAAKSSTPIKVTVSGGTTGGGFFLDSPVSGATVTSPVRVTGAYPCDQGLRVEFARRDPNNDWQTFNAVLDKNCAAHNGHPGTFGWSYDWAPSAGAYLIQAGVFDASNALKGATDQIPVTVSGGTGGAPPVVTVTANPPTVTSGQSSVITWTATNATSCSFGAGVGGPSGSQTVTPTATTTYTVNCSGPGGNGSGQATVTVNTGGSGGDIFLDSPAAGATVPSPTTVSGAYPCDTSLVVTFFSWPVGQAMGFRSWPVTFDKQECKTRTGHPSTFGWSASWSPDAGTHTIQAEYRKADGSAGKATPPINVTISGGTGGAPPSVTVTAAPPTITPGQSSVISWTSTNATSCSLGAGVGGPSGSQTVTPTATTTYTVNCSGPGGNGSGQATVTVTTTPPPSVTVTADPGSISSGQSSVISWTAANAAACSFNSAAVAVSGSQTVKPIATTTYTVSCTGPGGSGSGQAVVTVSAPSAPAITSFTADPPAIDSGGASRLTWTTTGVASCSIGPGLGGVPVNGTMEVRPPVTTTYVLGCTGLGGEASRTVAITVRDGQRPSVSLTAPMAGARIAGISSLIAAAADNVGVAKVEFFAGAERIGEDAAAPYEASWNTAAVPDGDYVLTAKAYDAAGNAGTSAGVAVTVRNAPPTPILSLIRAEQTTVNSTVILWQTDVPADGQVEYGLTPALGAMSPPSPDPGRLTLHSVSIQSLKAGTVYHYRVRSAAGGPAAVSDVKTFTTLADTEKPNVAFQSPLEGGKVSGLLEVVVTATDNAGAPHVELRAGDGMPMSPLSQAPYRFRWDASALAQGSSHRLEARAIDASGNQASAFILVTIKDLQSPTVSFVSPSPNTAVKGVVTLEARAEDNLGVIERVEFYVNRGLIATDRAAPFTADWDVRVLPPGTSHDLQAKAYDADGNWETADISVKIADTEPPVLSVLSLKDGGKVAGVVRLGAEASDRFGMARVEFHVDGELLGSDERPPYRQRWDSSVLRPGTDHEVKVVAVDSSDNRTIRSMTVTVISVPEVSERGEIGDLGGRVGDAATLLAEVEAERGFSAEVVEFSIAAENTADGREEELKRADERQRAFVRAGTGVEITARAKLSGASLRTFARSLSIRLAYDPLLAGDPSRVGLFYWDRVRKTWQAVANARAVFEDMVVSGTVDHLTTFAAFSVPPSAGGDGGFEEVFAYPNPATGGRVSVHAEIGPVESVELRVYDLAGALVHSETMAGSPAVGIDGRQSYEFAWDTSGIASGVYWYVLQAPNARAVRKLAVVR